MSSTGDLAISASDLDGNSVRGEIRGQDEHVDDGGLFGSDEEDEGQGYSGLYSFLSGHYWRHSRRVELKAKRHNLDEEELGSEDDDDKPNQEAEDVDGSENEATQERAQTILDVGIGRHAIPKPSDGEVREFELPCIHGTHHRLLSALPPSVSKFFRNRVESFSSHKFSAPNHRSSFFWACFLNLLLIPNIK